MAVSTIMQQLGFVGRTVSVNADRKQISDSQIAILDQVCEFGVDAVYFNTDENGNSFPAIFLKEVKNFDEKTLQKIAEAHRKIWNYKKALFLYVYSETEIRIYNCSEKPLIKTKENFDCEKELQSVEIKTCRFSDKNRLQELNPLFSRIAIDTGTVWTLEEAQLIRDKINLQRRVDKYLITSLVSTAQQLEKQGLAIALIHKIILRSLFLLYLEDRGAADEKFYSKIKKGAASYFDILEDIHAAKKLFEELEEHFNGNVFTVEKGEKISAEQLRLIKKCFISGCDNTPQTTLFENWRLFDFSIIPIELLSEIYENFLFKTDPELKKKTGAYYTPPSLVEFMLNEKLPAHQGEKNYHVKVLDPSCGSGIFLAASFKRLVKRFENQRQEKLTDFEKLKKLLTDHIFGIELHPQAIKVAAFSLYLALLDNLDPKTLWQKKKYRLPNLINDPNDKSLRTQGGNLFCRDAIKSNPEIENTEFDLVIGNPPFGTADLSESMRRYCDTNNFAKEKALPFLHKAITFAPNGEIALIFNTKVLTNTGGAYQNFRKWLFNNCYAEKVFNFSILRRAKNDFGGQLFGGAAGPISLVFYRKEPPQKPSDKMAYYVPKTYLKSNMLDGLSIDFTDLKYLPREECRKPDTKIWKIAMWGGANDWELLRRLSHSQFGTIKEFAKNHHIKSGAGFQLLTQKKDKPKRSEALTNLPYLDADFITKYYTHEQALTNANKSIKTPKAVDFYKGFHRVSNLAEIERLTAFRRLGDTDAFINPHLVIKKGLENNRVCASCIDVPCSFRDGVYGFYSEKQEIDKLYFLSAYFNSRFSAYFLFMTISSYGIEREQVMKNEYLSIPINEKQTGKIKNAAEALMEKLKSKNGLDNFLENEETEENIKENIDKAIYESLGLSANDISLLNDCIEYSMDLFHRQEKSKALYPTLQEQIIEYGKQISAALNDFLDGQHLFANAAVYGVGRFTPLMLIKLSFEENQKEVVVSKEFVDEALKKMDKHLWEKKASNIYFRKKLNYKTGNDVYIIRPNQRRFWSKSMAAEDASELILEILKPH